MKEERSTVSVTILTQSSDPISTKKGQDILAAQFSWPGPLGTGCITTRHALIAHLSGRRRGRTGERALRWGLVGEKLGCLWAKYTLTAALPEPTDRSERAHLLAADASLWLVSVMGGCQRFGMGENVAGGCDWRERRGTNRKENSRRL